jgi:hypothetical protein
MKFIFNFFLLFGLVSCTPIYISKNKQRVKDNDKHIAELTDLIIHDNYSFFLSQLKINNEFIYNAKDTLGFGYYMDIDHRCYNDEICFGTTTIRQNDSIVSVTVYPSFSSINPVITRHYERTFKKSGWKFKGGFGNNFESKIFGFKNSINAVADPKFTYRPKPNKDIDSLMSPIVSYSKRFDLILDSLTENDLLYLLHSVNPGTRLLAIKHIKCKNIPISNETNDWMNYVIRTSPRYRTMVSRCVMMDKPIEYFLDCK